MSIERGDRTIQLQDRDLQVLRGLFEARVMTAEHVASIYFDGRYEAARKRLQKLKAAGYVGERPRRSYDPAVLFLTRRAFAVLCQRGTIGHLPHLTWASLEKRVRVSDLTLRHELQVQDVKAALHRAAAEIDSVSILEFSTWPALYLFDAITPAGRSVSIKPDGFIRLREHTSEGHTLEHVFYLELDRSTESQEILVQRAACYRDHYRHGGLAKRFGSPPEAFEQFPFRVLMVFQTAERRNNTAERLLALRPPLLTQVWLSTLDEVTTRPMSPVWIRPVDYREAIRGTEHTWRPSSSGPYRRQTTREQFIETAVKKHVLFASSLSA